MLTKKEEIFSDINTEILYYESKSDVKMILLPGNPGIGDFYEEFANHIIKETKGDCCIYIISYAGFTLKKPDKLYSITEELDHKEAVIKSLSKNWTKKTKVVFLGHSIGSWLTQELVKKFHTKMSITTFLLFPFIALSPDVEVQKNFSNILQNQKYIQVFLGGYLVLRKLPSSMILPLIKIFYSHISDNALAILKQYFIANKHIPETITYLAKTEFLTLSKEIDFKFLKKHKNSVVLFYCHDDLWAPLSQNEKIQKNVKGIQTKVLSLINHDFCVNTEQSQMVAEEIMNYLKNFGIYKNRKSISQKKSKVTH